MVNRTTYKERNNGTFQPYKLSNEINNIKQFIWDDSPKSSFISVQHHYVADSVSCLQLVQ